MKLPSIIYQSARSFADPAICERIMRKARWPDGKPVCPACGSMRIGSIATRKVLRCKDCRKAFGLRYGTIFERSPLDLGQWLLCFFALIHCPDITCQQIADLIGVTITTGWRMRKKLKLSLSQIARPVSFVDGLEQIMQLKKRAD